jgi:hypothetical protein
LGKNPKKGGRPPNESSEKNKMNLALDFIKINGSWLI